MNGRIYDPLLGRFLSADIVVQSPDSLQSYNRYSYVMNNPLNLVDPTGWMGAPPTWMFAQKADMLVKHHGQQKGLEIAMQSEKAQATGTLIGTGAVLAGGYIASLGAAEIGREIVDEVVDQVFERTTGISAPVTSIIDLGQKIVKEGAQRLAKEGAEAAGETVTKKADNLATNPTPKVEGEAPVPQQLVPDAAPPTKSSGQLGREGEAQATQITGAPKNTESFEVNGRTRIPDQVQAQDIATRQPTHVTEVKNVQKQSLTQQLRDDVDLVGPNGRVDVMLPKDAKVTKPLQRAFDDPTNLLNRKDLD